jgi:putative transposase
MSDRFQDKYRIPSSRLQNWNYGWNGIYFITICTKDRECYFGDVVDFVGSQRFVQLYEIGRIARQYWSEIPSHFPFAELDEFVIMPNHIHGIIIINKKDDGRNDEQTTVKRRNKFGPQSNNIASVIRGFKAAVKKYAIMNNIAFEWQSRFYDNIVQSDESFNRIRQYIQSNPSDWAADEYLR